MGNIIGNIEIENYLLMSECINHSNIFSVLRYAFWCKEIDQGSTSLHLLVDYFELHFYLIFRFLYVSSLQFTPLIFFYLVANNAANSPYNFE